MRFLAALFGLLLISGSAQAASTINPTQPIQGVPYNAAPIRLNFGAAANDINALQTLNAGQSAPSNPSLGYLWIQTGSASKLYPLSVWDGVRWLPIGTVDALNHVWTPPIGGGVSPSLLSAMTTDLGSVPASSVTITGVNPISSYGSSAPTGALKIVLFTAATPLVNSASLILPGNTNITQAAGGVEVALAKGGGIWQVVFDSQSVLAGTGVNGTFVCPTITTVNGVIAAATGLSACPLNVANNAALKALPIPVAGTVAYRAGFTSAGDGGGATYTFASANCSISGGDNGLQVQPTTGVGCWIASFTGPANVMVWGAYNDGTNGATTTTAINAALADYPSVYLPPGTFHVTDELKCPAGHYFMGSGQQGSGGGGTVITVGAASNDFNMSANGVVQVGAPNVQGGCTTDNYTISFYQPDVTTPASMIAYPVALDGDNIHGSNIAAQGITIEAAWDCYRAASPVTHIGGIYIGRISCSSFHRGFYVQGSTAFINVNSWDQETYGLTTNQSTAYQTAGIAGTAIAAEVAEDSGVAFTTFMTFAQGVVLDPGADFASEGGSSFGTLILDSDGASLSIADSATGAIARIGSLESTKGMADQAQTINVAGPLTNVQIGTLTGVVTTAASPAVADISAADSAIISATNGSYAFGSHVYVNATGKAQINFTQMTLTSNQTTDVPQYQSSTLGRLNFTSCRFVVPALTRSQPLIKTADGLLTLQGSYFTGGGSSFGPILTIGTDEGNNLVQGNHFGGWTVSLPAATPVGYYDMPDVPFTSTVTPQFATIGDFSPVSQTTSGTFFYRGAEAEVHFQTQFSANAYTTASGGFSFATNFPHALPGEGSLGIPLVTITSGITASTGAPAPSEINGSGVVTPGLFVTGSTSSLTTTNIPASGGPFIFNVSGRYRVR